jgi:hypothetical protein
MKKPLSLVVAALLSGCSVFELGNLKADGAKASAFCVEGSGSPLSGSGHVAGMKADKDFVGSVTITPECGMIIESR